MGTKWKWRGRGCLAAVVILAALGFAAIGSCTNRRTWMDDNERRIDDAREAIDVLQRRVADLDAALRRETKARVALEQKVADLELRASGLEKGK